jgi:uncharacterized protein (TIGR02246 family)
MNTMHVHGDRDHAQPGDAEAVRALYLRAMDGWNRGSGDAFAAPFAETSAFVAFDGVRFHGREEIARFHDPLLKTHLRGTRLVGDVTDIRFLSGGVAIAHAYGGTVLRGRSAPAPERDSIQTLVAVKRDGQWWLVAFQNTRVRPIGRTLAGTLLWLVFDWFWKWCLPKSHERTAGSVHGSDSPSISSEFRGQRAERLCRTN